MKLKDLRARIEKKERLTPETRFDRYFARKISIYITWILVHTKVSANQVTASQLVIGGLGCVFIGTGEKSFIAIGIGLLHFSYILDCVDGEIARFRGSSSLTGIFFDEASHSIFNAMLYAGLAFSSYRAAQNALPFLFGFAAVIFTPPYGILYLHDALIRQLKSDLKNLSSQEAKINKIKLSENSSGQISGLSIPTSLGFYKKIAYKTGFFFTVVPYSINLVTVAFILDLVLAKSSAGLENSAIFPNFPKGMSFLYLSLIYFGLTLPLRHTGGLARSIIKRRADIEYQRLFQGWKVEGGKRKTEKSS